MARGVASQRQELDLIEQVFWLTSLCDDLQIADALADGNAQLVSVNHAGKWRPFDLSRATSEEAGAER